MKRRVCIYVERSAGSSLMFYDCLLDRKSRKLFNEKKSQMNMYLSAVFDKKWLTNVKKTVE